MQPTSRRTVLELVRRGRAQTRRDLAQLIGLSRSSVAQLVAELVAEGLLTEHPAVRAEQREERGRPSTLLRLVPRNGWVAAIDLGHRHVAVAIGDLQYNLVDERQTRYRVDASAREALALAQAMLVAMLARHGAQRRDLLAVGVSVPFPVVGQAAAPVGGVPGWDGIRPGNLLGLPGTTVTVVGNNANLGAWGEYVAAAETPLRSLLYLSMGEGVGGGLVADGQIFNGTHGVSGEIGHVLVPGCTLPCRCGRTGCLDALVTAANNGGTGAGAAGAAEAGADRAGVAAGAAMGSVLAQVASFVDPDLIVLGGELGCDPAFAATVAEAYERHQPLHRAGLVRARLGLRSALLGAFDRATQEAWARLASTVDEQRAARVLPAIASRQPSMTH